MAAYPEDFVRSAFIRDVAGRVSRVEMLRAMREWCEWTKTPYFTPNEVYAVVRSKGFRERKSGNNYLWLGMRRRDTWYPIHGVTPGASNLEDVEREIARAAAVEAARKALLGDE